MQVVSRPNRTAFTLLELMVMVILVGLIAGIAVVSVSTPFAKIRMDRCVSEFVTLEKAERRCVQRDAKLGQIIRVAPEQFKFVASGRKMSIPSGIQVTKLLRLAPGRGWKNESRIAYVPSGQSATFVVQFENRSGMKRWLTVLGITGQATLIQSEREIQDIMRMTQT